MVKAAKTC